ncbi:MAG: DUF4328 domain-containing protein [Aquihabitans sp.]
MSGGPMPPGWYPDPWYPGGMRWFDGTQWTEHAGPAGAAAEPDRYDPEKGRNTAKWAGWAFLARSVLVSLQLIALPIVFSKFFDDIRTAIENPDTTSSSTFGGTSNLAFTLIAQGGGLLVWATLAAIMVWTFRATKNANLLGIRTQFSPGLACGGWIIPLASLVMPYLAVRDVFPEGHSGRRAAGIWWAIEISASVAGIAGFVAAFFGGGFGAWVGALGAVLAVTAGVLGFRLTRAVVEVHEQLAGAIGAG